MTVARFDSSSYTLALDHGTSGIKAALVGIDGSIADFEFVPTSIRYVPGGGAEQDAEEWWLAACSASKTILARGRIPASQVKSISVSSTFSTTVMVGSDGEVLMPALTWMDSRGAAYVKNVVGGFPSVIGYNLFRLRKWISKSSGGPALSGKDNIAHALLVQHAYPDVYEKTHMFLPSKDFFNLRLTGEFASSYEAMQLFWVSDIRDINNIKYDDELIALLGIDRKKLPPMRNSTDVLSTLRAEVADDLGLSRETKVFMGASDHQCALVGSGAVRDYEGHLYIGTSSWIECNVPFKKTDVFHQITSLPGAIPGKHQVINEQDYAGGAVSFFIENFLRRSADLLDAPPQEDAFALFNALAASSPVGSNGLMFAPWLNGERTPVDDNLIRGGWHNLSKSNNLEDMARAVLEGVALNTRWSLYYVERFIGRPMEPLHIIGGGATSDLWCQIFADVSQRTIRRVKHPTQANARGAAWLAAIGSNDITVDDIPNLIECEATFTPNPEYRELYDQRYKMFLQLYRRNKRIFSAFNAGIR
jgi:xylulokinase